MSSRSRPPSRKPPSQRRESRESPQSAEFRRHLAGPALDFAALDLLCAPVGTVRVAGASVPILMPHADPADPTDFDRAVCAAGLRQFVRPRVASDGLDALIPASIAHMLIQELAPGIRTRVPIELLPAGSLN